MVRGATIQSTPVKSQIRATRSKVGAFLPGDGFTPETCVMEATFSEAA